MNLWLFCKNNKKLNRCVAPVLHYNEAITLSFKVSILLHASAVAVRHMATHVTLECNTEDFIADSMIVPVLQLDNKPLHPRFHSWYECLSSYRCDLCPKGHWASLTNGSYEQICSSILFTNTLWKLHSPKSLYRTLRSADTLWYTKSMFVMFSAG